MMAQRSSLVGNLVKAVVQTRPGADPAEVRAAIQRECSRRLASYMVPRIFEFSDAFEKTLSQKIVRARATDADEGAPNG